MKQNKIYVNKKNVLLSLLIFGGGAFLQGCGEGDRSTGIISQPALIAPIVESSFTSLSIGKGRSMNGMDVIIVRVKDHQIVYSGAMGSSDLVKIKSASLPVGAYIVEVTKNNELLTAGSFLNLAVLSTGNFYSVEPDQIQAGSLIKERLNELILNNDELDDADYEYEKLFNNDANKSFDLIAYSYARSIKARSIDDAALKMLDVIKNRKDVAGTFPLLQENIKQKNVEKYSGTRLAKSSKQLTGNVIGDYFFADSGKLKLDSLGAVFSVADYAIPGASKYFDKAKPYLAKLGIFDNTKPKSDQQITNELLTTINTTLLSFQKGFADFSDNYNKDQEANSRGALLAKLSYIDNMSQVYVNSLGEGDLDDYLSNVQPEKNDIFTFVLATEKLAVLKTSLDAIANPENLDYFLSVLARSYKAGEIQKDFSKDVAGDVPYDYLASQYLSIIVADLWKAYEIEKLSLYIKEKSEFNSATYGKRTTLSENFEGAKTYQEKQEKLLQIFDTRVNLVIAKFSKKMYELGIIMPKDYNNYADTCDVMYYDGKKLETKCVNRYTSKEIVSSIDDVSKCIESSIVNRNGYIDCDLTTKYKNSLGISTPTITSEFIDPDNKFNVIYPIYHEKSEVFNQQTNNSGQLRFFSSLAGKQSDKLGNKFVKYSMSLGGNYGYWGCVNSECIGNAPKYNAVSSDPMVREVTLTDDPMGRGLKSNIFPSTLTALEMSENGTQSSDPYKADFYLLPRILTNADCAVHRWTGACEVYNYAGVMVYSLKCATYQCKESGKSKGGIEKLTFSDGTVLSEKYVAPSIEFTLTPQ